MITCSSFFSIHTTKWGYHKTAKGHAKDKWKILSIIFFFQFLMFWLFSSCHSIRQWSDVTTCLSGTLGIHEFLCYHIFGGSTIPHLQLRKEYISEDLCVYFSSVSFYICWISRTGWMDHQSLYHNLSLRSGILRISGCLYTLAWCLCVAKSEIRLSTITVLLRVKNQLMLASSLWYMERPTIKLWNGFGVAQR